MIKHPCCNAIFTSAIVKTVNIAICAMQMVILIWDGSIKFWIIGADANVTIREALGR